MRSRNLLLLLAAFVLSVQAQNPLQELAKHMPKCSLTCIANELPKSRCATNPTSECLCTDKALTAAVTVCAMRACTVYENLQTQNITKRGCGVPIRYKGDVFLALGIAGVVFAVLAFVLRIAASLGKNGRRLWWDDASMAVVVVLAIPPAVFAPFLVQNGLGRDIWTLEADQITNFLRFFYFGEIFYVVALGITKISILFSFLRVFPAKSFRLQVYWVMGASVAYTIAFFFATAFQCTPVRHAWTNWDRLHEGKCNNIHLQGWVAAGINIFLDVVVMILPLKDLARLNMSLRKKIMVIAMFSVGIFVIFTSAIRLYSLVHFANSKNITWDYVEAGYWSLVEIDISIFCGCMPAHRMLLAKAWRRMGSTLGSSKGNTPDVSRRTGDAYAGTTAASRLSRASVKPVTGDEGGFIPLVDVETKSAREVILEASHPPRKSMM
ncbi:hypothetical protein CC86DRAFT_296370 [Ophiobolus disseminans]|uniref:CFEM domain-containing protein n=1 Tax=Ophiobolus disseminans TaxID=1469910 RepID=A0A6A6ZWQ8_9PLEO|nr:hypothetical protein CC86DRAFT_296370 [Ophiobolus disseminans]